MTVVARLRSGIAGAAAFAILGITLAGAPPVQAADPACPGGKVKYYRNPMGTPDTSPVPKKDSMNMDYIPVCEDASGEAPGTVKVSLDKVQRLGVRTEEVQQRTLSRTVRAFASLQFDERRQFVVAPKFSGWIEKLAVNATGDTVKVGQDLFDVYSPELNILQQQWRVAGRSADATDKLRYLAFPEAALEKLRRGDPPSRTVVFPSPVAGTVIDKIAIEGMHFQPGDALFRIVDTSNMWVMAEVYEQDLAFVKVGDTARVTVNAWPGKPFDGKVTFIYPNVGKDSRTARLRIEVPNPDGRLRAEMAATVEVVSPLEGQRIVVPESAVIDSGRRQAVLVERGEGHYEPRPVRLGVRVPGYVEVLDGVQAGERVVTQATFLIDAESNIRAALAAFGDAK
jgi:Cu(I)/Ag(I) efflux system membrane fusion protein